MIGSLLMGGLSLAGQYQANKQMGNIANNQPSEKDLRSTFSGSQGLIDRMTNFNQYSGGAMDLATQTGNQGVQDAMMLGQGGSQANAIRNRLKSGQMNKAYEAFQGGLGDAAKLQGSLDNNVFGQLNNQRSFQNNARMTMANNQMKLSSGLLGEGGLGVNGLLGNVMGSMGIPA
jgi:hypothetical protein